MDHKQQKVIKNTAGQVYYHQNIKQRSGLVDRSRFRQPASCVTHTSDIHISLASSLSSAAAISGTVDVTVATHKYYKPDPLLKTIASYHR